MGGAEMHCRVSGLGDMLVDSDEEAIAALRLWLSYLPSNWQEPPPLTPVAIDPDPDFTNFADDAFDEQLAGPSTDVLREKQVKAVGPPKPASGTSLVFWLAIVPLLVMAAGGFWLSKKGSAVLKVR